MSRGDMTPQQVDAYDAVLEPLAESYGKLALKLLERIRDVCHEAGLSAEEPFDMCADDYRWSLLVYRAPERVRELRGEIEEARRLGRDPQRQLCELADRLEEEPREHEDAIDITLEIAEAQEYGDSEDHPFGINFGLRLVEYGGRIVGELMPYNYTPQCWVDARDPDAVQARWEILERADLTTIPELIGEQ